MTKISFVALLRWLPADGEPVVLGSAAELSDYSFFQRGSIKEFMTFTGKTVVRKTAPGARQTVKAQAYMCHAVVRDSQLAAVVFCDEAYPSRAAMSVAMQSINDFEASGAAWRAAERDAALATPLCEQALVKYQVRHPCASGLRQHANGRPSARLSKRCAAARGRQRSPHAVLDPSNRPAALTFSHSRSQFASRAQRPLWLPRIRAVHKPKCAESA